MLIGLARRSGNAPEAERRATKVRRRLEAAANRLQEEKLQLRLRTLAEALIADPFGAYR